MLAFLCALALISAAVVAEELAANQLLEYLNQHQEPAGTIHTSYGYPVTHDEANFGIYRDSSLLLNPYIYESISHFSLERRPARVIHCSGGGGAKGYFEVTHDVSNITNVKNFNTIGKRTPVFVRFSSGGGEIGSIQVTKRGKGMAIKFYTEEGNMDLVGSTSNGFLSKEPAYAASIPHIIRSQNPRTGLSDSVILWDFIGNHPQALLNVVYSLIPSGQPRSYRNIRVYAAHTFQVENDAGETSFVKFNWFPDAGEDNLSADEIQTVQATKPEYYTEELYNSIANGTSLSWTLYMQVIPMKDIHNVSLSESDIFDISMNWPAEDFPNTPVGKLVLNRNVDNYFAEVEQSAFNPANLVAGVRGVDKVFEARTFIYRDCQIHRLGTGFNKIPVNCPLNRPLTYNRDGHAPVNDNGGDSPNYYPNSFHGIVPRNKTMPPLYRPVINTGTNNYWQVAKFYNNLSEEDQQSFVALVAQVLVSLPELVRDKVFAIFVAVDSSLAATIQSSMDNLATNSG